MNKYIFIKLFTPSVPYESYIRLLTDNDTCVFSGRVFAFIASNSLRFGAGLLEYSLHLFTGCEWNSSFIQPKAGTIPRGLDSSALLIFLQIWT